MRRFVFALMALCAAAMLFAAGGGEAAATAKKVEVRWLTNTSKTDANFPYYDSAINRLMKDRPEITVILEGLESAQMRTKLLTEMAAGAPPNAFACWLNYAREFIKDDKSADWNPILADPRYKDMNKRVTAGLKVATTDDKGRMILFPASMGVDGLFYNKELFAKNGWTAPKTFDEFIALGPKARAQNIYAIGTGGKDFRFAWLAAQLVVRTAGTKKLDALTLGDSKDKWDDPAFGFPQAVAKFKQLVDAGAYPKGTNGIGRAEIDEMFCRGELATQYEGTWLVNNFTKIGGPEFIKKVGRVSFPAMPDMPNGDPNSIVTAINGYSVASAKYQTKEQLDASILVVKYLTDDITAKWQMEEQGVIFANVDFDRSKMAEAALGCVDAVKTSPGFGAPMDTVAPPAVDSAIKKTAFPMILNGSPVKDAVAEVQKAASDYVKSLEKK